VDRSDTAQNWPEILARAGLRLGRADPDTAPIGYQTLMVWQLAEWSGAYAGAGVQLSERLKAQCSRTMWCMTRPSYSPARIPIHRLCFPLSLDRRGSPFEILGLAAGNQPVPPGSGRAVRACSGRDPHEARAGGDGALVAPP